MKVMETRKTVSQKEQRMLFARALAAGFKVADMLTLISSAKLFWNLTFDKRKRLSLRVFFGNVVPEICNALSRGILELRSESKIGRKEWDESAVVTTSNLKMHQCRLFDNQVYGVVHGLLMGHRENLWPQAQSLFIKVKEMDG
ncbi:hypothetical protein Bca4012_029546 [Brassica carinata]